MDFTPDPDEELIRDAVRAVCARFDDVYWSERDAGHEFPWEFYAAMADGGWVGIAIPEAYGGGGRGINEASLVLEEVAASGAAMNGCSAVHLSIFGMHPVVLHGSEEMRTRYLPRVAKGERILIASEALGVGRVALRRAVAYAKERIVFGRPIGQNQAVAFPLAEIHARLRAAEMMIRRAAWMADRRMPCGEEANLAKYLAAEAGFAAADHAVQVHGAFGYAEEYHVARYWREARLMKIAPITQELVLAYVTEHVLGLPRSY